MQGLLQLSKGGCLPPKQTSQHNTTAAASSRRQPCSCSFPVLVVVAGSRTVPGVSRLRRQGPVSTRAGADGVMRYSQETIGETRVTSTQNTSTHTARAERLVCSLAHLSAHAMLLEDLQHLADWVGLHSHCVQRGGCVHKQGDTFGAVAGSLHVSIAAWLE